jgi:hypothetical protein
MFQLALNLFLSHAFLSILFILSLVCPLSSYAALSAMRQVEAERLHMAAPHYLLSNELLVPSFFSLFFLTFVCVSTVAALSFVWSHPFLVVSRITGYF